MIARRLDGKRRRRIIAKEPETTREAILRQRTGARPAGARLPERACEAIAARLPQGGTGSLSGGM